MDTSKKRPDAAASPAAPTDMMEAMLDRLLLGKPSAPLDSADMPEAWRALAEKLNKLNSDVAESMTFGQAIANGHMDVGPPSRSNYLAGPYKELHSQLTSFCWSIEQLTQGNMVSKLFYPGKLFQEYNALIEKVSQTFSGDDGSVPQWGNAVTSWRYHQILSAINNLRIMILEVAEDGRVVFANPPAREMLAGLEVFPYDAPVSEDGEALLSHLCAFAKHDDRAFPVLHELYDRVRRAWYKITTDRVKLTDGSTGLLHVIDDISDWKQHEAKLKKTAEIDTLTGAYTRKAGFKKLDELIQHRLYQQNQAAFVDIDGLKEINDVHGHNEGDFAIRTVAEILLSCVRDSDWVVRYGGDEFLILFLNCPESVARAAIDRMYVRLEEINKSAGKPYRLSFSAGLSTITEAMETATDLVTVIDERMYASKVKRKAMAAWQRNEPGVADKGI